MAPVANPTRSSRSRSLGQRRHGSILWPFSEIGTPIGQRRIHTVNIPERTRSRAMAEATHVDSVVGAASHRSLSFSDYSDYYERPSAGMQVAGSVSDAAPTELDWEIGG